MIREIIFWGEYFHGFYEHQEQNESNNHIWRAFSLNYSQK